MGVRKPTRHSRKVAVPVAAAFLDREDEGGKRPKSPTWLAEYDPAGGNDAGYDCKRTKVRSAPAAERMAGKPAACRSPVGDTADTPERLDRARESPDGPD